jgi:hypothetical protein
MRSLQLLTLALLATAARADIISQFSSFIEGNLSSGAPFSAVDNSGCNIPMVEIAFVICGGLADYGDLSLSLVAAGSGPDSGPKLFAEAQGTVGFTDRIIFYGPVGQAATVVWDLSATQDGDFGATVSFDVNLPSTITFNVPYYMSALMSNSVAAGAGEDENSSFSTLTIQGFQVFGPTCDSTWGIFGASIDPSCGPPRDVSIHTRSGFLYGGHVPEPSSLLLLATAGIALLASRARRRA